MTKKAFLVLAAVLAASCANTEPAPSPVPKPSGDAAPPKTVSKDVLDASPDASESGLAWNVHFSPKGGCTQAVSAFISGAKSTVRLQAYGFTSQDVADALVGVAKSGKDVQVVLDRSDVSAPSSKAAYVAAGGVKVWIDSKHAIAHSKVVVVDSNRVETGSFNFTEAAEKSNAENCLILYEPNIAFSYSQNWEEHRAHSVAYP
jgi:phosphatidylserine/phosphatidylglycerophosphate/cardiolipin synthase-like enzyme